MIETVFVEDVRAALEQTECSYSRMLGMLEASHLMSVDPAPYTGILSAIVQEHPTALHRHMAVLALLSVDAREHWQQAVATIPVFLRAAVDVDPAVRYAAHLGLSRAASWSEMPWDSREKYEKFRGQIVRRLGDLVRDPFDFIRLGALQALAEIGNVTDPSVKEWVKAAATDRSRSPSARLAASRVKWAFDSAEVVSEWEKSTQPSPSPGAPSLRISMQPGTNPVPTAQPVAGGGKRSRRRRQGSRERPGGIAPAK